MIFLSPITSLQVLQCDVIRGLVYTDWIEHLLVLLVKSFQ